MNQKWLFESNSKAQQEFAKKEKAWTTGILVLIEQSIYYFTDRKEWEKAELKGDSNYAWVNLGAWHGWLIERKR
jgi:hypothetical protein